MSKTATLAQIAAAKGKHPRDHIVRMVETFAATYASRDWNRRADLMSQDVVFEDTVGVPPPAIRRDSARDYFKRMVETGWSIVLAPERIAVMGDEAFVLTYAAWGQAGEPQTQLYLFHNFQFNEAGEISRVRIAYDEESLCN